MLLCMASKERLRRENDELRKQLTILLAETKEIRLGHIAKIEFAAMPKYIPANPGQLTYQHPARYWRMANGELEVGDTPTLSGTGECQRYDMVAGWADTTDVQHPITVEQVEQIEAQQRAYFDREIYGTPADNNA